MLGGEEAAPSSAMADAEALETEDTDAKKRRKKPERKKKKVQPLTCYSKKLLCLWQHLCLHLLIQ